MADTKLKFYKSCLFLLFSLILYGLILFGSGEMVRICCFASIVLCWLNAITYGQSGDRFIIFGLLFTIAADYFLVLGEAGDRVYGMVCFLIVQLIYAAKLNRHKSHWGWKTLRAVLTGAGALVTYLVLGEKTDALAVISVCYYANLILNLVIAFAEFQNCRLFAVALFLFLLCDTVIGLQAATSGYLTVDPNRFLLRILYPGFNLAWMFYLPSQVLISLNAKNSMEEKK